MENGTSGGKRVKNHRNETGDNTWLLVPYKYLSSRSRDAVVISIITSYTKDISSRWLEDKAI